MIKQAKKEDREQIIRLWREAFGDDVKYIEKALKFLLDYMILYKRNEKVCAMLTALPVSCGEKRGRYIYAVATFREYQNQGIAGELLEYVKQAVISGEEDFCVLVPAGESLFEYYKKHGFETVCCVDKITLTAKDEIKPVRISVHEYFLKRREYIGNLIEWPEEILEDIRTLYNGEFYRVDSSIFFAVKDGENLYVKEFLGEKEDLGKISGKYENIIVVTAGDKPFAMVYPKEYSDCYFNIAID